MLQREEVSTWGKPEVVSVFEIDILFVLVIFVIPRDIHDLF